MRLIVATQNNGKLKEIKHILRGVPLPIISLNSLDKRFRIRENGATFLENAVKKTKPVSRAYGDDLVVGEDSGLEVKALGGKPGVRSKRYCGPASSDDRNNRKLLKALAGFPKPERKAAFRCVLVLMRGGVLVESFQGILRGYIHGSACGSNGFGYDPVFYLGSYKKTLGQLARREKNRISHRAQAFLKLKKYLGGKSI